MTGERRCNKRGRGEANKTPFVAAVECSAECRPLAMRMTPLTGFRSASVDRWARHHLWPDAELTSDGLPCLRAIIETCPHSGRIIGGGLASMQIQPFTCVSAMPTTVKNLIHGTWYAIHGKHLGRYLGEFSSRFNGLSELYGVAEGLVFIACRTAPLPYRLATTVEEHT